MRAGLALGNGRAAAVPKQSTRQSRPLSEDSGDASAGYRIPGPGYDSGPADQAPQWTDQNSSVLVSVITRGSGIR